MSALSKSWVYCLRSEEEEEEEEMEFVSGVVAYRNTVLHEDI
jgi:hypothetical protein